MSMIETIAPVKKAKYIEIKVNGKPKIKPITKANFASPIPIPFPLVIKINRKKNKKGIKAIKKLFTINSFVLNI